MLCIYVSALFFRLTNQEPTTSNPSSASKIQTTYEPNWRDAVVSGLQHVKDVLTEETQSPKKQGEANVPYEALWPCIALCACAYLFWARRIPIVLARSRCDHAPFDDDSDSIKSDDNSEISDDIVSGESQSNPLSGPLIAAAVAYWLVMPLVMLAMGFMSTPQGGAPLIAYGLWLCFWLCHMAAAFRFGDLTAEGALLNCCSETLGKAEKLFYGMLEHLDMATDALFVGLAAANGDSLTKHWVEAWQEVPLGPLIVPLVETIGFSGVALVLFITTAYLPQLLVSPSIFTPFLCLVCLGVFLMWVLIGALPGLLLAAVLLALCECTPSAEIWWRMIIMDFALKDDAMLLRWLALEMFAPPERDEDKDAHQLAVVLTKVVFENGPQLWLQSAFLAMTWDHLTPKARSQTMLSVLISLALSGQKLVKIMNAFVRAVVHTPSDQCRARLKVYTLIATVLLCATGFLAWVVAKFLFIFFCPTHLWNLSTGCVD